MIEKITLIASLYDPASLNIKDSILLLERKNLILKIDIIGSKFKTIYETKYFRLIEINAENVYQDLIDRELNALNMPASFIIFLSRHSSKSKFPSLTVHSTGNYGGLFYGGNNYRELSIPSPIIMSHILQELSRMNNKYLLGCDVTLEITHHGPTKLNVPSFFVEIGSTINEWCNKKLGYFVALSILNIIKCNIFNINNTPIVVGFGGNHYVPIPTQLTLENKVNFGHIFPKYQINNLTVGTISEAFMKSNSQYAFLDKKSIPSQSRKHLIQIIENLGYSIYLF